MVIIIRFSKATMMFLIRSRDLDNIESSGAHINWNMERMVAPKLVFVSEG